MGAWVVRNRHGHLAYRLRWDGIESHEGTKLSDTVANRERLKRLAAVMAAEMKAGTFDYLRWFPGGNAAHKFRGPEREHPTLEAYAEQWLERKRPPFVRASLRATYTTHLRSHPLRSRFR